MGRDTYIPALEFHWLTPLYDPLIRWTMPEAAFKRRLIEQSGIESGHRVLDLGCGTGTMTLDIKRTHPQAHVVGLDGDEKVLEIARAKAEKAEADIGLDRGMAFDLPYRDGSFDRVVSSLMLHHLSRENKIRTFSEVYRVLRPGGELHIADWGKAKNILMRAASLWVHVLDRSQAASDHVKGLLPEMIRNAGFEDVHQTADFSTLFGTLALLKARKPECNPGAQH